MTPLWDAWEALGERKTGGFAHGYPENLRRLFSPVDAVHVALVACLEACQQSLMSSMYSWSDAEINKLFLNKLKSTVFVQLSLDSTQGTLPHEVPLIHDWGAKVGNSLSLGHSSKSDISHMKTFVCDGILTIGGSTNMSHGGEFDQNNEMIFVWDAVYAAETTARLAIIHDEQLMQMQKKQQKLAIDWASKKSVLTLAERHALEAGTIPRN